MNDKELNNAWRRGNDAGCGFALGDEDMTPEEAAKSEGLENIRIIDPEGTVVGQLAGYTIVIADSHGPWAVTIGCVVETDD